MKKPKLSRYPKRPKATANSAVWDRYYARCKTIDQRNEQKMKPYLAERKRKKEIVKKVDTMKTAQTQRFQKQLSEAV